MLLIGNSILILELTVKTVAHGGYRVGFPLNNAFSGNHLDVSGDRYHRHDCNRGGLLLSGKTGSFRVETNIQSENVVKYFNDR